MGFLDSFKTIWKGGYYEGNPEDPMGPSEYGIFGFHSSLYLIYRVCIKPYVTREIVVLEIGPGRGAWTKVIANLGPRKIYAVDVVDPEYAGFWDYVGRRENVEHVIAKDCSLAGIPDGSIDFFFSFGCFCHLRPDMVEDYITALARKMKPSAHGFLMIADYDKFNACVAEAPTRSLFRAFNGKKFALVRVAWRFSLCLVRDKFVQRPLDKTEPPSILPGAWFHFGTHRAVEALEPAGLTVIESDAAVCHRDPVLHFVAHARIPAAIPATG